MPSAKTHRLRRETLEVEGLTVTVRREVEVFPGPGGLFGRGRVEVESVRDSSGKVLYPPRPSGSEDPPTAAS